MFSALAYRWRTPSTILSGNFNFPPKLSNNSG